MAPTWYTGNRVKEANKFQDPGTALKKVNGPRNTMLISDNELEYSTSTACLPTLSSAFSQATDWGGVALEQEWLISVDQRVLVNIGEFLG